MARIPDHIIDEIMNTSRIEEVIGDYIQLKKAGSNYKALSPFTEEKTPSFMVSPAKQIFKCFSTGKGGTVVTFLMEIEQYSYPEALKWLADKYNIEIPEDKPLSPEEQQALTERESLQIVNTFAKDFFVDTIKHSKEGKTIGYSYFKERGFREDTIEKFQLGYCPAEEKSLTETAIEKGYKQVYLEQLGLTKTKGDRRFDFFSGRVMFPIHSVSGKVLGFGGRTLRTDKKIAKYFNSPESILYDKSRILYGIYFAKSEIVKQDNCFLVEGYTDVISLAQSGVENVVSSSGTSLTKGQIKLIRRYTKNITVLYDSDAAGIKASFRGIDLLLEEGMTVKVLSFPEGEDPDSFAKKSSSEELKSYLENNQKDFVGFKTQILLEGTQNDPIKKSELIREIVGSIALIPDSITRSVYIKETANQFEMKEQTLLNELNKIRRRNQSEYRKPHDNNTKISREETPIEEKEQSEEVDSDYFDQEFDLLRILVLFGDRAIEFQSDEGEATEPIEVSVAELIISEIDRDELSFNHPLFRKIYLLYQNALKEGLFYDTQLLLRNDDQDIVKFAIDIMSPRHELSTNWLNKYKIETAEEIHKVEQAVKEALYTFKNVIVMRRIKAIQHQLKQGEELDTNAVNNLLIEQNRLEKVKRSIAAELNRKYW